MFAEDTSAFFDVAGGFAVDAMIGASVFPVIFDNAYLASLGGLVESTGPVAQAQSADVAGVQQGDTITINATAYTVTGVQPDGTGVTLLQLREA